MRRVSRVAMIAVALLGTGNPVAAASTTLTGTIEVVATIDVSSDMPANMPLSVTTGTYYDVAGASANGSVTVTAKHSGNKATVTLELPYRITAPSRPTLFGVTLSVSAESAEHPYASASAQIPVPANGATTIVKLPAAI